MDKAGSLAEMQPCPAAPAGAAIPLGERTCPTNGLSLIHIFNEGKIAEQGSHSALLKKSGVYAAMWADYQRSTQWKVGKEAAV